MQQLGRITLGLSVGLILASALWFSACATGRMESLLPSILMSRAPSATSIGSDVCSDCHDGEPEFYMQGAHKKAFFQGETSAGCESCHGRGSVHADYFYENDEYVGDAHDLVGSADLRAMTESERSALCQQCHQNDFPLWPTTDHARGQVGCWDCHPSDLHTPQPGAAKIAPVVNAQSDNEFCTQCHDSVGAEFALQYHHRVPEGQMNCADCHSIHGESRNNAVVQTGNSSCLGCHAEVQGPWVYEHLGMEEGCESCHSPHGSVNNKLLVSNDNSLCVQCHFQEASSTFGRQPHGGFPGGFLGGGGLCYDCHSHVHGSNTDRNFNPRRY